MIDSEKTVDVNDDLDAFSDEFFGKSAPAVEPEGVEEEGEEELEPVASDDDEPEEDPSDSDDEPSDEGDGDDEPGDEDDEEEEEEAPEPQKPAKKSARERINELTAKARQAERDLADLRRQLEERDSKPVEEKPAAKPVVEDSGPDPDALGEDGEPLYPLGEFDPLYIRALTKHTIQQERELAKKADEEAAKEAEYKQAETALAESWSEKLVTFADELPDLREKAVALESDFAHLDPHYGQYLAATIMSLEYGPHVLDYLADHPEETRKIVESGPTQATLSLARIEARVAFAKEQKETRQPSKTTAPPPPPRLRGSGTKTSVKPDTDDLDAFEKAFFKKR